eukprot:1159584-Pelagomonas_calceolata.AAC.4
MLRWFCETRMGLAVSRLDGFCWNSAMPNTADHHDSLPSLVSCYHLATLHFFPSTSMPYTLASSAFALPHEDLTCSCVTLLLLDMPLLHSWAQVLQVPARDPVEAGAALQDPTDTDPLP